MPWPVRLLSGAWTALFLHLEHTGRGVNDTWAGLLAAVLCVVGSVLGSLAGAVVAVKVGQPTSPA